MRRVIREHLRDFIAVIGLFLIGLAVTGYVLSQQQQPYPSWIPVLGDDRFELKAELSTAQAVTPGQGQTVNISGVKAGDISKVELVDGNAVVTMLVEAKYADLIHPNATVLLRPRTGLQDMTMELDPGTGSQPIEEGTTLPLSQTEPNVNPDQILAALDGDTRDYLQLLLQAGGEGLGGRGKELSAGPAALRAARARPRRHQRAARSAAREHRPLDHQLPPALRGARAQRHPPRRVGDGAKPGAAGVREPERGAAGEPAGVPVDAAGDPAGPAVERPALARGRPGVARR